MKGAVAGSLQETKSTDFYSWFVETSGRETHLGSVLSIPNSHGVSILLTRRDPGWVSPDLEKSPVCHHNTFHTRLVFHKYHFIIVISVNLLSTTRVFQDPLGLSHRGSSIMFVLTNKFVFLYKWTKHYLLKFYF